MLCLEPKCHVINYFHLFFFTKHNKLTDAIYLFILLHSITESDARSYLGDCAAYDRITIWAIITERERVATKLFNRLATKFCKTKTIQQHKTSGESQLLFETYTYHELHVNQQSVSRKHNPPFKNPHKKTEVFAHFGLQKSTHRKEQFHKIAVACRDSILLRR